MTDEVYVRWNGNNDPKWDGKTSLIKQSMIETPPNASEVGTAIITKPWPSLHYFGTIISAEEAADKGGTKRKKREKKSGNEKKAKVCGILFGRIRALLK